MSVTTHHHDAPVPRWDPFAGSRLVVGAIPLLPDGWVDRDTEVDALTAAIAGGRPVVVCAGGRGVGKSMLAAAYARARAADPGGPRVIAWVNGETLLALLTDLALLARELGVTDPAGDLERSAGSARHVLNSLPVPGLLVVDNAEHPHHLGAWLPSGTGQCQVIITSTDHQYTQLGTAVTVGVYDREQSITYLQQQTRLADPDGADLVADTVGDLPLGVGLAAAAITRHDWTYQQWLTQHHTQPVTRTLPAILLTTYPKGLVAAVGLSMEAVTDRNPHTGQLVTLLAVLDPAGITPTLLEHLGAGLPDPLTGLDLDETLAVWVEASLATRTAGHTISVHRLTARVIRDTTPTHPTLAAAALHTLAGHTTGIGHQIAGLPPGHLDQIARHALALLTHTTPADPQIQLAAAGAATRIGNFLTNAGAYQAALTLDQTILDILERTLGPTHPYTLGSRNNLAVASWSAGRHDQAIPLYEATLATLERVLGPEHPTTLTSRNNLANAYRAAGRLDEAITLHEATLTARERTLGPDHPHTLQSRNNLATAYADADRLDEAITLHEATLTACELLLGPDHPDTLGSRNNLATVYAVAGRHDEAIPLHKTTLATLERTLGPEHPTTLTSRNNLANAYADADRHDQAIPLHKTTLTTRERVLGPEHPDTLASRNNLANAYRAAGRRAEAVQLLNATAADMTRALGPDHPYTVQAQQALAELQATPETGSDE